MPENIILWVRPGSFSGVSNFYICLLRCVDDVRIVAL